MSEHNPGLKNETLRALLAKASWEPRSAELLWDQAVDSEDYRCLVIHSCLYREAAIERLIELNPGKTLEQLKNYDGMWPYISSAATRVRVARILLDSEEYYPRKFHEVAENVPELREEAISGIVENGARWWLKDVNAVWRWGDSGVRDAVWEEMIEHETSKPHLYFLKEIILKGVGDLPERAWEAFKKEEEVKDNLDVFVFVFPLLDDWTFGQRVWEWLKSYPSLLTRKVLVGVMKRHDFTGEALQIYVESFGTDALISLVFAEDEQEDRIKRMAVDILLSMPLDEAALCRLLQYRPVVGEVVNRLLY